MIRKEVEEKTKNHHREMKMTEERTQEESMLPLKK